MNTARGTRASVVAAMIAFATARAPSRRPPRRRPRPPSVPGAATTADAPPPAPDTVLATVNGQKITQLDVTLAAEDLGPQLQQQLKGRARDAYVLDYLVDSTLVAQKAKADGAEKTPDFAAKMEYAKDKVLMESVLTGIAKSVTDDADAAQNLRSGGRRAEAGTRDPCASRARRHRGRRADRAEAAQGRRGFREGRQGDVEGSGFGRRRPRLVHQGADGAGLRRRRVQAEGRADLRSREDAVSAGT